MDHLVQMVGGDRAEVPSSYLVDLLTREVLWSKPPLPEAQ